jgi:predicted phage terminase large subunit-like protein
MNDREALQHYYAELGDDFGPFMMRSFIELNPGQELVMGPHIEVTASKLADVREGRTRRLIMNVPPRHLKSHLGSIAFPAWCLGHNPSTQLICVSYAQDLSNDLATGSRGIMMSDWYPKVFPKTLLTSPRPALQELRTTLGGHRLATSVGGVLTGRGADIIIIDDPLKPMDALSDSLRQTANDWFDHTLLSRLNDKRTGAIVIIMQRVHEDDLVGHVLGQEDWEVVCFPAIAEEDEVHHYKTPSGPRVFRRRKGEVLQPEREPLEIVEAQRQTMGMYAFAAQYQQAPVPIGGSMIKLAWFKRYTQQDKPESFDLVVDSWDTANKVGELADYSVCTSWGIKGKHHYLLHVFRKQLEYPDLKRAVRQHCADYSANVVLIEDKASGTQLLQELRCDGLHQATRYKPEGDKVMRMYAQTATIENGFVHLPMEAPWLADFLHEIVAFPNGKYDDQVDSTAQFLDWRKAPMVAYGAYEYMRREAEKAQASGAIATFQTAKQEYAIGSMEWQAEQERKKAEEEARSG